MRLRILGVCVQGGAHFKPVLAAFRVTVLGLGGKVAWHHLRFSACRRRNKLLTSQFTPSIRMLEDFHSRLARGHVATTNFRASEMQKLRLWLRLRHRY